MHRALQKLGESWSKVQGNLVIVAKEGSRNQDQAVEPSGDNRVAGIAKIY